MKIDIRPCKLIDVRELVERYHGYGSMSNWVSHAFAVYEAGRIVAAFAWQPPPMGAAKSACPEAPLGVLALSRMVAVPKTERKLKHISKPLIFQSRNLIDRTRWPVLITYSDESQGHTGYVYQCAGWEKTIRRATPIYEDARGARVSRFRGGVTNNLEGLTFKGKAYIQRWENWACNKGAASTHMRTAGWERVPIPGKVWKSGNPAHQIVKRAA